MSTMMKKILSLVLVVAMVLSMALVLTACKDPDNGGNNNTGGNNNQQGGNNQGGNNQGGNQGGNEEVDDTDYGYDEPIFDDEETALLEKYDQDSRALYEEILGEFYIAYRAAKRAPTTAKRYAMMAIAEAKLLASGVMLPTTTQGGNYAISRVAPYTATTALWGNDSYRYHNVVITTNPISAADRDALKAMWAEATDGAAYEADVREYLTEKGYSFQYDYSLGYSSDPQTWDVLATSMAADSEAIVNTYDGLLEYDLKNNLQGALATEYSYNWKQDGWTEADGYKVTFKLREGAKWVDVQGRVIGTVKADDFVAGLQHMMDAAGGLEYLTQGVIVNADEYINGEVTDFAEVGVKAVDDYTLVYELCSAIDYFDTMVGYGVFAPLNRAFYEQEGGKFGEEYDPTATDYTYGTSPEKIAYCGPYTVTSLIAENSIVFTKNANYWNAAKVTVNKITWKFNDGSDPTKAYNDMKTGELAGAGLNQQALQNAKTETVAGTNKTYFELYGYVSGTDATSYMAFANINREAYANYNDATVLVSPKTDAQKALTKAAMLNQNFRLALAFAVDRGSYNAQSVGEELKLTSLRNTYTPGTFVKLDTAVTVKINGVDTTFPAGTFYGAIIQAQLDADQIPIKAWDPTMDGGIGSSDGYDGWYNAANAQAFLAKAIEELAAEGVVVNAENPIVIDFPCYSSTVYLNRANAYKQSIEAATNNLIKINIVECAALIDWYYAGYYPPTGAEGNYDVCDVSGWGPDYGDPSTYLDTMLPDYAGYMTKAIGIF